MPHLKFNSEFFQKFISFRLVFENFMKIINIIIAIANATCPSKCDWVSDLTPVNPVFFWRKFQEIRDFNELLPFFQKIFDGDDKIASVDALTTAGTNEKLEFMDVFDQDTYTRL